jgi:hypothetical protein
VRGALAEPTQASTINQVTQTTSYGQALVQQTHQQQHQQQQQTPARAQSPASAAAALAAFTCPPDPVTLSDGAELSSVQPGRTYLLRPGTYTITNTLQLSNGQTTCFQGANRNSVTVLVATNINTDAGRAISVTDGAKLGLFSLTLDGQLTAPGVSVLGGNTALRAADVIFKQMRYRRVDPGVGFGGAAVGTFVGSQVGFVFEQRCPTDTIVASPARVDFLQHT